MFGDERYQAMDTKELVELYEENSQKHSINQIIERELRERGVDVSALVQDQGIDENAQNTETSDNQGRKVVAYIVVAAGALGFMPQLLRQMDNANTSAEYGAAFGMFIGAVFGAKILFDVISGK